MQKKKLPKGASWNYRLAITPGILHLAYEKIANGRYRGGETMYSRSLNVGRSWRTSKLLSTAEGYSSIGPDISASKNGDVIVMWRDGKYGSYNGFGASVIYRQSRDKGKSWNKEQVLSKIPEGSWPQSPSTRTLSAEFEQGKPIGFTWAVDTAYSTYKVKVRVSLNGGETFCDVTTITPDAEYAGGSTIMITRKRILVAWADDGLIGYDEIYFRSAPVVNTVKKQNNKVLKSKNVALAEAFPNPANPTTTLSFNIGNSSVVTVKVYNVVGEEVAILMNNASLNKGNHEMKFDASSLSSGIYYYRIFVQTDDGESMMSVKKLVLLK